MLSKEKQEWLKSIGAKKFKHPMKWHEPNGILFSEEYLESTPIEEIKSGYDKTPKRME